MTHSETKICVLSACYNEELLLPYFLRHYELYCDRIVLYDNQSTDRTAQIASAHPKVTIRTWDTNGQIDENELLHVKNEAWKEWREEFDWKIVVDVDEFLYHPTLLRKLQEYRDREITIARTVGFEMRSMVLPSGDGQIYDEITRGVQSTLYSKCVVFNPREVDINFAAGCHSCNATGNARFSEPELKLLHYSRISHDSMVKRARENDFRLSESSRRQGLWSHLAELAGMSAEEYARDVANASEVMTASEAQTERASRCARASQLAVQGESETARRIYRQLDRDCERTEFRGILKANLASLDVAGGSFDDARAGYERALELDPNCRIAKQNLSTLEERLARPANGARRNEASKQLPNPSRASPAVYGFLHIAMMGRWKEIVNEQIQKISGSGLYERTDRLFVVLLGENPEEFPFRMGKIEVAYSSPNLSEFEFPTLQRLWEFCQSNDGLIYYLHTKGVSRDTESTQAWRRYMEHFIIERHERCIKELETNDICGVDWFDKPWPHFSGNFWWATSRYVRQLSSVHEQEVFQVLDHGQRHNCERWIGSGAGVRAACLHQAKVDHYLNAYPPERYVGSGPPGVGRLKQARRVCVNDEESQMKIDRPIVGFMHVAMKGNWRGIVTEQILKLKASGLWDRTARIFVGLLGPDRSAFNFDDEKLEVVYHHPNYDEAELPTLAKLQEFCASTDCLVYYMHTKGVFRVGLGQDEWRRCMEYFLIMRHSECIARLSDHDVCGINWQVAGWCQFFRGNFWWARSDYIRKLPDIRRLEPLPGLEPSPRHVCERWIGEDPSVRAACLHDTRTDHYANQPYPRSRYAHVREVVLDGRFKRTSWAGLENRFQDLLDPIGPIRRVVDIGVEWGLSTMAFATALPQATVIGVDPYQDALPELVAKSKALGIQGVVGSDEAEAWLSRLLPDFPNIVMVKTTSAQAARQLIGSIDVVHIDAIHTYEDIAEDFALWEPKVRPGGCILFHDIESFPYDVGRFFQELPGRKASLSGCHGLGAWYKPLAAAIESAPPALEMVACR